MCNFPTKGTIVGQNFTHKRIDEYKQFFLTCNKIIRTNLCWNLITRGSFMASFRAVMTHRQPLSIFGLFGRGRQLKPWVHVLAGRAIRTEAGEVVHTKHAAYVSMPAVRTVATETSVIPAKLCCSLICYTVIFLRLLQYKYVLIM